MKPGSAYGHRCFHHHLVNPDNVTINHILRESFSTQRLFGVRLGWKQGVVGSGLSFGPLADASESDPLFFLSLVEHLDEFEVGPCPRLLERCPTCLEGPTLPLLRE
jgi:hypothetical protein